jgi:hypothetical protein
LIDIFLADTLAYRANIMASKKKAPTTRRITFKKADYQKFAKKMDQWSSSLSPEERALLIAVLDKGSAGIRNSGDATVQTTMTVGVKMERDFDLGQFIVEVLLALEGITAEVDEDGPSFVDEISWAKT